MLCRGIKQRLFQTLKKVKLPHLFNKINKRNSVQIKLVRKYRTSAASFPGFSPFSLVRQKSIYIVLYNPNQTLIYKVEKGDLFPEIEKKNLRAPILHSGHFLNVEHGEACAF